MSEGRDSMIAAAGPMVVGVAGTGAWGRALAAVVTRAGHRVDLADRSQLADDPVFPADTGIVLLVVPAQVLRSVAEQMADSLPDGIPVIVCAKGIERSTSMLMTEVAAEVLPGHPVGILSGPNFAGEVQAGLPAAAALAMEDGLAAEDLALRLGSAAFRLYASDDPVGVALGGAVKNVLAIAAGAVMGAGLGLNARAAVIARGLAEMQRLGRALGAREETMAGLSGLGDLVLSCTDATSRNYRFGMALGQQEPAPADLVEGVHTVAPLVARAAMLGVEVPIAEAVNDVLHHGTPLDEAVAALLARPGGRAEL